MNYIKLQICCMIILIYLGILYFKTAISKKVSSNKYYELILIMGPLAVTFDGATAWTVNHLDIVPAYVNSTLHFLFYLFENISILLCFLYMHDITVGLPKSSNKKFVMLLPFIVSTFFIAYFMPEVYYVTGTISNYSMGTSVIACYSSMIFHFIMILIITIKYNHTMASKRKTGIYSFIGIITLCFIAQCIWPEILISALYPTIFAVGTYINFEDPYIHYLETQNQRMVESFATMVENRDNSTGGHIKRTGSYVSILIQEMSKDPRYQKILTKDYKDRIIEAAPIHDIGKVAIPDSILQKPGPLTDEEYKIMKTHSTKGCEIVREIFKEVDDPLFIDIAYDIAKYHHERWDGKGYPYGLINEEIPLHSRIMAIADVFDAVSEERCYRSAMPFEDCIKIIEDGAGTQFDPDLAMLFVAGIRKENT